MVSYFVIVLVHILMFLFTYYDNWIHIMKVYVNILC